MPRIFVLLCQARVHEGSGNNAAFNTTVPAVYSLAYTADEPANNVVYHLRGFVFQPARNHFQAYLRCDHVWVLIDSLQMPSVTAFKDSNIPPCNGILYFCLYEKEI